MKGKISPSLFKLMEKNKTLKETDGKMNFDSTNPGIPTEVKKSSISIKQRGSF